LLNPFPLDLARRSGRAHAHHNPMEAWAPERTGRYRLTVPCSIPDEGFNTLFAALPPNRDRALIAFWISSGIRASELIFVRQCDVDRASSGRAARIGAARPGPAVWWTLRRPFRPLTYHGAHRMFERVNASFGADWTLHDLRHSAAARQDEVVCHSDRRCVRAIESVIVLQSGPVDEDDNPRVLTDPPRGFGTGWGDRCGA
jgi:integrase